MVEDRTQGFLTAESETSFETSVMPAERRQQVLAFQTKAPQGPSRAPDRQSPRRMLSGGTAKRLGTR